MQRVQQLIIAVFVLIGTLAAPEAYARKTKKKVVYRKHTQLDFSGESVQGKIRAPEVFYIFQRRRSSAHKVAAPPKNFNHHRSRTISSLKEKLPK